MNYQPPKPAKTRKSPKNKMKDYRARMRAAGLRPIQIWVPDVRAKGFQAKLRREVASLNPAEEKAALEFIEAVADLDGWE